MTRQLTTDEKIDALLERIDNLEREVLYLRKRLEKYENPKNSKNNSKPPSSDFPRFKKLVTRDALYGSRTTYR